jgi:3-oxoacyl-[acyl-carrier protein] reductase
MATPDFSLAGKVALITGAKRGIGQSMALTFAEAGADLVVCGRSLPELEAVGEEVKALGRRCLAIRTDVTVKNDVASLVSRAVEEFGTIDVLVNNVVVYARGALVDLDEQDWDLTVAIGLKGYYLCSQAVARVMMEKRKGAIINMSSTAGMRPTGWQGAYSVIKAGGIMMTQLMAVELAEFGIRVNALAPTVVKAGALTEDLLAPFMPQLPLGRLTELHELSAAALFLASDASSYISGHTLVVDGGRINTFPRIKLG